MGRKIKCNNCKAFCYEKRITPATCDLGYEIERVGIMHTALGDINVYTPKCGKCRKPKTIEDYFSLLKDKQMGLL